VGPGAAGAAGARLDEMQIGEPKPVERFDHMAIERHGVRLAGIIGNAIRRQTNADAVRAPDLDGGLRDLEQEARAVLDGARRSVRVCRNCSSR
jgi:hypothetical protein